MKSTENKNKKIRMKNTERLYIGKVKNRRLKVKEEGILKSNGASK